LKPVFSRPLLRKLAFQPAVFANVAVNQSAKAVINQAATEKMTQFIPIDYSHHSFELRY
jgi:hypothetical protein